MIGNRPLILDRFCELHSMLEQYADQTFYEFDEDSVVPSAIYIVSRQQMIKHVSVFKRLAEDNVIKVVLTNPAEGADTMYWQCRHLGLLELIQQRKILVITGAQPHGNFPCLVYEHLLIQSLNYQENHTATQQYWDSWQTTRPYKFLFLNGRNRAHRKYLLERFKSNGLLEQSLWTNLDPRVGPGFRNLDWYQQQDDSVHQWLPTPDWAMQGFEVRKLPKDYEVSMYRERAEVIPPDSKQDMYVYQHLFAGDWGAIYLEHRPYADTYFSVVTETTFDYTESFRTEKISKPLAIGHPWIAVANAGFYRDIKNLGFQTFEHLIDEGFDTITDPQSRAERIVEVVEDLCSQDLGAFISAATEVCKYNQQQLAHLNRNLPQQFIKDFFQYIKENI